MAWRALTSCSPARFSASGAAKVRPRHRPDTERDSKGLSIRVSNNLYDNRLVVDLLASLEIHSDCSPWIRVIDKHSVTAHSRHVRVDQLSNVARVIPI